MPALVPLVRALLALAPPQLATVSLPSTKVLPSGPHTGLSIATTSGTSAGFSEIDLQAEEQNTLTPSDVTTDNGTTGLDIQANDVGYSSTVQIGTVRPFPALMGNLNVDFLFYV